GRRVANCSQCAAYGQFVSLRPPVGDRRGDKTDIQVPEQVRSVPIAQAGHSRPSMPVVSAVNRGFVREWNGLEQTKPLRGLVGLPGFEPGTSCTPSKKYQSLTSASV